MASQFDKNFEAQGYRLNYLRIPDSGSKHQVLQFLVEIKGITPQIWRRIQVPANYNFWDLHVAIQVRMKIYVSVMRKRCMVQQVKAKLRISQRHGAYRQVKLIVRCIAE